MKTAKIWIYWNDTESLIKLREGECVTLSKAYKTDEGYHQDFVSYQLSLGKLTYRISNSGRDCDGRYQNTRRLVALIGACPRPQWREMSAENLDYSAIAANY